MDTDGLTIGILGRKDTESIERTGMKSEGRSCFDLCFINCSL